jgi:hypothetical protein
MYVRKKRREKGREAQGARQLPVIRMNIYKPA